MKVFLKYFLFYFVIAFCFRIIFQIAFTKQSINDSLLVTINNPKVFFYTVALAFLVTWFKLKRDKSSQ